MKQTLLPLCSPVSYAPLDYVVTDINRLVFESLMQPDKWGSYGCLLMGAGASGKTHLAHIWQEKFNAGYYEASEISQDNLPKDAFVVIENIDAAHANMEALFHLLNAVRESSRTILLSAAQEPKQFASLADVLSRLNAMFHLQVPPPDEAMLNALLLKLFSDRQIRVPGDVIGYILSHYERSFAGMHKLVEVLNRYSLIKKQGVNIPLVKQVLEENL